MLSKPAATVVLIALISFAELSFSAMLGAPKGLVHYGRPFDISIPVRMDEALDDMSTCFNADLFQGESSVDNGRIRIDVTPASNKQNATVRVRSQSIITEPWAKMVLRSNCGPKVTRQYDFLTDFISDLPASATQASVTKASNALDTGNTASAPAITSSTLAPMSATAAQTNKSSETSSETIKPSKLSKTQRKQRTAKAVAAQKSSSSNESNDKPVTKTTNSAIAENTNSDVSNSARLKMETFELSSENSVLLKLSAALTEPTGMRTPEEIQALAQATAVWRAINGMPPLAGTSATNAAIAPEAASSADAANANKSVTNKNASVFDLSSVAAAKQSFSNPWLLMLLAILALALACIAWLWHQMRQKSQIEYDWLNQSRDKQIHELDDTEEFVPTASDTATVGRSASELAGAAGISAVAGLATNNKIEPELAYRVVKKPHTDTLPKVPAELEPAELEPAELEPAEFAANDAPTLPKQEFDPYRLPDKPSQDFDDERFDERMLDIHEPRLGIVHEKPINSTEELVDLVLTKDSAKLSKTPKDLPAIESLELNLDQDKEPDASLNTNQNSTGFGTNSKLKTGSNSIDFDIFAAPIKKPKPSK